MLPPVWSYTTASEEPVGRESGLPDLVAVHRDGTGARATIERLSRAGIDGGAIELLGRVEVVTAGRHGDRQTDLGSSRALRNRTLRGMAWGIGPGAVFGGVVLAAATTPTFEVLLAGAGGGAMFGAAVGVLTGLLALPTMAASWERTFAPLVPGGVVVGVRVDRPRTARRARRVVSAAPGIIDVVEVGDLDEVPDRPVDPHALNEP